MKKLVLASGNAGKLAEFQSLLAPLNFSLIAQSSLGVGECAEPHFTFIENALAKARHAAQHTGLPALADDSGLCVDALQGAPGVRSARWAVDEGLEKSDANNNLILQKKIRECQNSHVRSISMRYVCALVWLEHAHDPSPIVAQATWEGEAIEKPRGQNGFGYDAHFFIPALNRTVAELTPQEKNQHSHRGQAMRSLLAQLKMRVA